MNDKKTHKILQQSLKSPSNNFTDNLMLKVELENEVVIPNYFYRNLILILLLSVLAGVFIYLGNDQMYQFSTSFIKIVIPSIFIKLSFVSVILYGFYQLLSVQMHSNPQTFLKL